VAETSWYPFEEGRSLGEPGSEQGAIVRDEEHVFGARITLERGARSAPFAITCGIYGWMMHTRFFSSHQEAESQFDQMKNAISALLEAAEQTGEADGGRKVLMDGVSEFVEKFP
jgi:hypothetical protein